MKQDQSPAICRLLDLTKTDETSVGDLLEKSELLLGQGSVRMDYTAEGGQTLLSKIFEISVLGQRKLIRMIIEHDNNLLLARQEDLDTLFRDGSINTKVMTHIMMAQERGIIMRDAQGGNCFHQFLRHMDRSHGSLQALVALYKEMGWIHEARSSDGNTPMHVLWQEIDRPRVVPQSNQQARLIREQRDRNLVSCTLILTEAGASACVPNNEGVTVFDMAKQRTMSSLATQWLNQWKQAMASMENDLLLRHTPQAPSPSRNGPRL